MSDSTRSSVGTLSRGLDILSLFSVRGPELTQTEISEALGVPQPTVHRLTTVLMNRGFLERDVYTRRLRLGLQVTRLVPPLLSGLRVPDIARNHLMRLAEAVGESANFAVLDGREIVYLLVEDGNRMLRERATIGLRLPAHCVALGKCLLAYLPADEARMRLGTEPYESLTAHTHTSWRELQPDLEEIRRTGVSISEEEYELGLVSIAVPLRWSAGLGSAAINVSLPSRRLTDQIRAELISRLQEAARSIDEATAINDHNGSFTASGL